MPFSSFTLLTLSGLSAMIRRMEAGGVGRAQKPTDWREGRRLRAWELCQEGWPQKQIAAALGVSAGAVSQWIARGTAGGGEALRTQPRSGARPKLSQQQRQQLPDILCRGAQAYGFVGDVWTQERIATVVKREFGVSYHPDHIGRLLRAIGWSVRKPVERASERNDAAIERWRSEKWPEIKKKPSARAERWSG
ncbi:MAG TPA: IS630 family transposase [Roseiflexaceae bacterium]|nr:IS630 family transposase [Roseiflexaceae bacterium]